MIGRYGLHLKSKVVLALIVLSLTLISNVALFGRLEVIWFSNNLLSCLRDSGWLFATL